jgi:hypothetical protein
MLFGVFCQLQVTNGRVMTMGDACVVPYGSDGTVTGLVSQRVLRLCDQPFMELIGGDCILLEDFASAHRACGHLERASSASHRHSNRHAEPLPGLLPRRRQRRLMCKRRAPLQSRAASTDGRSRRAVVPPEQMHCSTVDPRYILVPRTDGHQRLSRRGLAQLMTPSATAAAAASYACVPVVCPTVMVHVTTPTLLSAAQVSAGTPLSVLLALVASDLGLPASSLRITLLNRASGEQILCAPDVPVVAQAHYAVLPVVDTSSSPPRVPTPPARVPSPPGSAASLAPLSTSRPPTLTATETAEAPRAAGCSPKPSVVDCGDVRPPPPTHVPIPARPAAARRLFRAAATMDPAAERELVPLTTLTEAAIQTRARPVEEVLSMLTFGGIPPARRAGRGARGKGRGPPRAATWSTARGPQGRHLTVVAFGSHLRFRR